MNLKNLPNLSIETSGFCNRTCSGCLRNSHPSIPEGYWKSPVCEVCFRTRHPSAPGRFAIPGDDVNRASRDGIANPGRPGRSAVKFDSGIVRMRVELLEKAGVA